MANHHPDNYRFSTPTYVVLFGTLLTAYFMYALFPRDALYHANSSFSWDTSMSQKSRFKMQTQGITTYRKTFPQLPGGTIENPKFIQTAHG